MTQTYKAFLWPPSNNGQVVKDKKNVGHTCETNTKKSMRIQTESLT